MEKGFMFIGMGITLLIVGVVGVLVFRKKLYLTNCFLHWNIFDTKRKFANGIVKDIIDATASNEFGGYFYQPLLFDNLYCRIMIDYDYNLVIRVTCEKSDGLSKTTVFKTQYTSLTDLIKGLEKYTTPHGMITILLNGN